MGIGSENAPPDRWDPSASVATQSLHIDGGVPAGAAGNPQADGRLASCASDLAILAAV